MIQVFAKFLGKEKALGKNISKLSHWTIFVHTFSISAFTIGGGYVMIPLMRERFVKKLGWISETELTELTALGQSAPGAMVINTSALMGYRLLGFWGAICAVLGTALPPLLILSVISYFYEIIRDNRYVSAAFRGMSAGIAAVIADTVFSMAAPYFKEKEKPSIAIIVLAFLVAFFLDINAAFIIISCGIAGIIMGAISRRRRKKL
ncbi:MAG: chromate transporter [Clostridiales bacterium]|nr:chromate transporter [Clostridiales bacterium]